MTPTPETPETPVPLSAAGETLAELFDAAYEEWARQPHEPLTPEDREKMVGRAFTMAMASFKTADNCREHYSEDVPRLLAELDRHRAATADVLRGLADRVEVRCRMKPPLTSEDIHEAAARLGLTL